MTNHRLLGISREELLRGSAKDVKLFLGGAKISNEINIATKMLWFSRNGFFRSDINNIADYASQQSLFNYHLNILAGHAYEAYNFFDTSNFRRLASEHPLSTSDAFAQPYNHVMSYFRGTNLIRSIRDKISFHNDLGFIYSRLENKDKNYFFTFIEGDFLGHNVYRGVDDLVVSSFTHLPKSELLPDDDLYTSASDQIFQVTDMMGHVLTLTLAYIVVSKFGVNLDRMIALPASPDGPPIDAITLPFFCAHPLDPEFLAKLESSLARK